VIAGTATAVSGKVAQNQMTKAQQQAQMQAMQAEQEAAQRQAEIDVAVAQAVAAQQAPPPPPPPPAPAAAAPAGGDVIAQLKDLAALRDQGILTDEEFAAQKARILGS
jgi:hypothetical protein